jgi:hypothetical protein
VVAGAAVVGRRATARRVFTSATPQSARQAPVTPVRERIRPIARVTAWATESERVDVLAPGNHGPRAPWLVRLRVARAHRRLDREIASEAPVNDDPARALRAAQLTSPRERFYLAAVLEHILEAAEERERDPVSRVRVNHAALIAARHGILTLIDVLRTEREVAPRGVALARLLIDDPRSPLLSVGTGRSAQQSLSDAIHALVG